MVGQGRVVYGRVGYGRTGQYPRCDRRLGWWTGHRLIAAFTATLTPPVSQDHGAASTTPVLALGFWDGKWEIHNEKAKLFAEYRPVTMSKVCSSAHR